MARSIFELIRWANRVDVRREVWAVEGIRLSPTELALLVTIDERGPVRTTDLAVFQGVDKSTLSPQVRRLERLGMVGRTADPSDARATPLVLTDLGRRTTRELLQSVTRTLEARLAHWSAAERAGLAMVLDRLVSDLDPDELTPDVPSETTPQDTPA